MYEIYNLYNLSGIILSFTIGALKVMCSETLLSRWHITADLSTWERKHIFMCSERWHGIQISIICRNTQCQRSLLTTELRVHHLNSVLVQTLYSVLFMLHLKSLMRIVLSTIWKARICCDDMKGLHLLYCATRHSFANLPHKQTNSQIAEKYQKVRSPTESFWLACSSWYVYFCGKITPGGRTLNSMWMLGQQNLIR